MLLNGICLNKENTMSQEFEGENTLDIKNTDGIYPNATVKISKIQYSIFELKRKYESPQRQDIVLDPDFQRGSVWTKKKQIKAEDTNIYYKPSTKEKFVNIKIDNNGHFTDKDGQKTEFPQSFFDATLSELLEMM
jgi:Zn/Cd-binding protein ZinT